jgi:hypothetical protein
LESCKGFFKSEADFLIGRRIIRKKRKNQAPFQPVKLLAFFEDDREVYER